MDQQRVPKPDFAAFGHEVAKIRRERHMSLDALAEASGLGRKTVINVENGHKQPKLGTAHALAFALDVPLSDLVRVL